MRYIILAAGKGVRANSEKFSMPKVLFKAKNGKSLLINNLEKCKHYNPTDVVNIVGGFMFNSIQTEIHKYQKSVKNHNIELIHNVKYAQGVMTSLYAGLINSMNDDIVILNGDTYYSDSVFQKINEIDQSTLLVVPKSLLNDSIRVRVKGENIVFVDKKIEKYDYLSIGSLYLKNELKNEAIKQIERCLLDNSYKTMIWHHIINKLAASGNNIHFEVLNNYCAFEIDTQEDYHRFLSYGTNHQ